ncbi:MAG: DNA-3-methyladenine glycosylase [Sporolactobacillus laevolacticus]|jgi:DNA-3-methyladenine glycosylase II|nr:DNA-3-methyladenine glycosylase [Sporolactobacillus laevolacticus]
MNWIDHISSIEICPPDPFDFSECLVFLTRSDQEVSHRIKDDHLYKLVKLDDELVLLKLGMRKKKLNVEFLGNLHLHPFEKWRQPIYGTGSTSTVI